MISFKGEISASKSIFNRALILSSFGSDFKITGNSKSSDVAFMTSAILTLKTSDLASLEFECGDAGTVLRFLALRLSRRPGRYLLKGSARLLSRPFTEIISCLNQLGVRSEMTDHGFYIESEGWREPKSALKIDRSRSSQFASGVLLNCWNLPFPLDIELSEASVSESYLELTEKLVTEFGLTIDKASVKSHWKIPQEQKITKKELNVEADASSVFAAVALGLIGGEVRIENWTESKLQPDSNFVNLIDR